MRDRTGHIALPLLGFVLALAWLSLMLNLPNWPAFWFGINHARLAPEAIALAAACALYGLLRGDRPRAARRAGPGSRPRAGPWALAAVLLVLAALRLADLAANLTLGRQVNLALDLPLLPSILEVLTASATPVQLALAAVGIPVVLAGILVLNRLSVSAMAGFAGRRPGAAVVLAGAVLATGPVLAGIPGVVQPLHWSVTALVARQVGLIGGTAAVRRDFRARMARDSWSSVPPDQLLGRLAGRDVTVVFVESYGRTVLTDPRFESRIGPLLAQAGARLADAGFTMRSGLLASPVRGGQSWLAHATLLTGLPLSGPSLYAMALTSNRATLAHLFGRAGYGTAAVMPAIRRSWPEGTVLGFDRILAADALGYAGPDFGWAAIPDQYTLSVLDRIAPTAGPVFRQVVLISSHGPWRPTPPLVEDWDAIGDGAAFRALTPVPQAAAIQGDYVQSIDYSLRALFGWIERSVRDGGLVIVLGDHQPAPLITGPGTSADVPIHVIGRDPDLVGAFAGWGFASGLLPGDGGALPMAAFRDRFLATFTGPAAGPATGPVVEAASGP